MPPKAPPKSAPGKKGAAKAPNAMVAKLKMQMEKKKEEEERIKREEEELERRAREEERLLREARKQEEEERRLEQERKKAEEKKLKKDKKKGGVSAVYERMLASGMVLPDVEKIKQEEEAEKDKPKPKPAKKQQPQQQQQQAKPQVEESDGEKSEKTESDEEIDEDDWEAVGEREERREARHANNERIRAERTERHAARAKAKEEAESSQRNLRSPICCVLGHVDTGKTSLLDKIRSSNVQGGEAGGITQQIGATFIPQEALLAATKELNEKLKEDLDVPGLLIIDTPGHESFTNLRSRGSSLCDIAVLVVDIMHGLEQQTKESLRLLRERKCPFIVALNKIDRLYGWEVHPNMDVQQTLSMQNRNVQAEFRSRLQEVRNELSGEGFNSNVYYENDDVRSCVSIVPLSAKTGEGICDLLLLEIKLVKRFMEGKVTYKNDIQCTVLEVKPISGHGVTIDVILINGVLHESDTICLCGQDGPIFTTIRYLMTPEPMHETRVRGEYVHHHEVKAAMGVKIVANDLENVVAGTPLIVVKPGDDREAIGKIVMKDATDISKYISADCGVTVQSSTLGALEALLSFLTDMKIPIANAFIGPMHKKHILQVVPMKRKNPRYSIVLAFDTVISPDAREVAQKNDIRIFEADVIYHLFDAFTRYQQDYEKREKDRLRSIAVFPVQLKVLADAIHHTDPIILPVQVERGQLREGTPLCALKGEEVVPIGRVMSMERDNKDVKTAKMGEEVAVKIHSAATGVTFGRQFDMKSQIVSQITRPSVDAVKTFSDELSGDDVNLLATLIKVLKVPKSA